MDHELTGEQIHGGVIEVKKAVPFENAGPPERDRESQAQYKLDHRRLRDKTHDAAQSVGEHTDLERRAIGGKVSVGGRHCRSPRRIAVNAPASITPAILAERSNRGV